LDLRIVLFHRPSKTSFGEKGCRIKGNDLTVCVAPSRTPMARSHSERGFDVFVLGDSQLADARYGEGAASHTEEVPWLESEDGEAVALRDCDGASRLDDREGRTRDRDHDDIFDSRGHGYLGPETSMNGRG
jgi:hypothetical protein